MKGMPDTNDGHWDLSDAAEPPKYTASWYDWRQKRAASGVKNKPVEEETKDDYKKRLPKRN